MANKLIKRRYNNLLTARNNYYGLGSSLKSAFGKEGQGWGALGSAVGGAASSALSGGMTTGAGNLMSGLSSVASAIPGPWGAAIGAGLQVVGGLTNRMFGSKMNTENIAKVESDINKLNNFQSNASDYDTLSQNWANANTGMVFSDSYIGKDGWFSNKAKKEAAKLRSQIETGNTFVQNTLLNNAANINNLQSQNMLGNYIAYGGPLFADGGRIYIKPENRGKFTETKRRTGKTTEELTHSKSPVTRKRAIFAQNAKKWHHAFGGDLMTHGADFDTGVTIVGNGGTHEENPNEGVPMGVDEQGIPNLVEEGEVIFDDYVFSNRLKVPKEVRKKYKLRGSKPLTFADAATQMSKESEERPNDPISKAGLEDSLTKLRDAQEQVRAKEVKVGNKFAIGGDKGASTEEVFKPSGLYGYFDSFTGPHSRMTPRGYAVTPFVGPDPIYVSGGKSPDSGYISTAPPIVKRVIPEGTKINPPIESSLVGPQLPETYIPTNTLGIQEAIDERNTPREIRESTVRREDKKNGTNNINSAPTWMRYIPAFASGVMSITDALGLTNKPDYGEAEGVLEASRGAGNYTPVSFRPIGNYLTDNPLDRDYYLNKLSAEAGATRRALLNTSGGNRAAAIAGLLAADYNALGKVGDLARQAEEYNMAQRQRVEEFNRATDMFNSEGIFKADAANQSAQLNARSSYLKGALSAAELRQKERLAATASRSANLSNFVNSLGDIGRENYQRNMIISDPSKYYYIDSSGNVVYKGAYRDLDEASQTYIDGVIARDPKNKNNKSDKKARGGYLTIKSKKR